MAVSRGVSRYLGREWKSRPAQPDVDALLARLGAETGLSLLTLQACVARGLLTSAEIKFFLTPRLENLTAPSRIADMDLLVDRLAHARETQELVWIYGDYDVDGTAGAALFTWVFREFNVNAQARQPDRFKDGYGLGVQAVEDAHAAGAQVILTVDCGITSFAAIARAKELQMDVLVVDHHQLDPVRGMPEGAYAVVNPQRADDTSGLKQLCGCGLAFYVSIALRAKGRELGWWPDGVLPNLKRHLDLVVMATSADMVPLTGDNHILVRHGLEVLRSSDKPGVKALTQICGITDQVSPSQLGFSLAPRINASGRMGSAETALSLLTTQDPVQALSLASQLEAINKTRATTQNEIWDQVKARVEEGLLAQKFKHAIVVGDVAWHEGVVGIVASRVTEMFKKPAIIIALKENGAGKGSARTYGGKDILSAIRSCGSYLTGFGGHKHAAGVALESTQLENFAQALDLAVEQLSQDLDTLPLWIDGECEPADFTLSVLKELESLGPFGPGNPEPVFAFKARAESVRILKERHLKLSVSGGPEAIWFGAAENTALMETRDFEQESYWAGVPEINRFRGRATPNIRVKDWTSL